MASNVKGMKSTLVTFAKLLKLIDGHVPKPIAGPSSDVHAELLIRSQLFQPAESNLCMHA